MKRSDTNTYSLQDILDSDDELPMYCDEVPFLPAYQNDNRFDYLEEQRKSNEDTLKRQIKSESGPNCNDIQSTNSKTIVLGYLNKKDTFCFHCLNHNTDKKTSLWFYKFLALKDLQSNYKFLTTCLVSHYNINNIIFD